MNRYIAVFENKQLVRLLESAVENEQADWVEDQTSAKLVATIEAGSMDEAQQKAERLEAELQTGQTKSEILQKENSSG